MKDREKGAARNRKYLPAAAALALLSGVGALVYASVPHSFTSGETLTAADLNGNFTALDQRMAAIEALIPAGTIIAWGGPGVAAAADAGVPAAPAGWLLCDGSAVNRITYGTLFGAIGINFGGGNSIDTFNVPDLRGRFLRGVDRGSGHDPEAASRTADKPTGNGGDKVGSVQGDSLRAHSHLLKSLGTSLAGPPFDTVFHGSGGGYQDNGMIQATGGAETRPINIAVNYLIKL